MTETTENKVNNKIDAKGYKSVLFIVASNRSAVGKTMISLIIAELMSSYAKSIAVIDADMARASRKFRLLRMLSHHDHITTDAISLPPTIHDNTKTADDDLMHWGKVYRTAKAHSVTITDLGTNIIRNFTSYLEVTYKNYIDAGILPIIILPIGNEDIYRGETVECIRLLRTAAPTAPIILVKYSSNLSCWPRTFIPDCCDPIIEQYDPCTTTVIDFPYCSSSGVNEWNAMEDAAISPLVTARMSTRELDNTLRSLMNSIDDTRDDIRSLLEGRLMSFEIKRWWGEIQLSEWPPLLMKLYEEIMETSRVMDGTDSISKVSYSKPLAPICPDNKEVKADFMNATTEIKSPKPEKTAAGAGPGSDDGSDEFNKNIRATHAVKAWKSVQLLLAVGAGAAAVLYLVNQYVMPKQADVTEYKVSPVSTVAQPKNNPGFNNAQAEAREDYNRQLHADAVDKDKPYFEPFQMVYRGEIKRPDPVMNMQGQQAEKEQGNYGVEVKQYPPGTFEAKQYPPGGIADNIVIASRFLYDQTTPDAAFKLAVNGTGTETSAWILNGHVFLKTSAPMISPRSLAEGGQDGTHVYMINPTNQVVLYSEGHQVKVSLEVAANAPSDAPDEADVNK